MIIDPIYESDVTRQFASQMEHIPHEIQSRLEPMFEGDKSLEYYSGLLAGYANALMMIDNDCAVHLRVTLAFVASKLEAMKRG